MRSFLLSLVLGLLLSGCAAQNPLPEETLPPLPPAFTQPEAPDTPIPPAMVPTGTGGRQFSLPEDVTGFLMLDQNLLLFSGRAHTSVLTLADPETGNPLALHEVPFVLTAENATVQLLDTGLSYFDPAARETVVLDRTLREVRRIAAPEDLTGMPLLSSDGRTQYYCTPSGVRRLDLDSGISRVLKEAAYPVQGLSGLLAEDRVLQLSITEADGTWRTLFLSGETGQLLSEQEGNVLPRTAGETFFLPLRQGSLQTLLFGRMGEDPMVLHPRLEPEDCFFLGTQLLTTGWEGDTLCLDLYDLNTGLRTGSLSCQPGQYPVAAAPDAAGNIWMLWSREEGPLLECLEPETLSDQVCYAAPCFTRQNPDYEGLAACTLYAEELSGKYGIGIRIYKDAAALEPWDYHLDYEYQPAVLRRELEALDERLGRFPEGFLQTLKDTFTGLNICLVRSAEGSPESGSPAAVSGIQFLEGFDAYIVLATDHDTEYALYHELSHLMETVVLTESTAYDRWDDLNPGDFRYDNDYAANRSRDGSPWLKEGREYFIDTYAMSYPKEDRARLFEYAMTAGHEDLFASPNLQRKLRQLCAGIREGFGLRQPEGSLPWEQYLSE